MTNILKISENDFESAVDIAKEFLQSGKVIIHPTDTLYGLAADATSKKAVDMIKKIKCIGPNKPLSVMVSGAGMIEEYCETNLFEDILLGKYLPGPYTFIVKQRQKSELEASNTGKIGVRIPDSVFCIALAQKFGKPIITTSANITGTPPPTKFEDIGQELIDSVSIAIDGGETKYKAPSIVMDLIDRKMIRGESEIGFDELPQQ